MSDRAVTNPEQWHIYPAGAHHKLTECTSTLHHMIQQHRPDLMLPPAGHVEPGCIDETRRFMVVANESGDNEWVEADPVATFLEGHKRASEEASDDLERMRRQIAEMGDNFDRRLSAARNAGFKDGQREADEADEIKLKETYREGRDHGIADGILQGRQLQLEEMANTPWMIELRRKARREGIREGLERAGQIAEQASRHPAASNEAQAPIPPSPSTPQASHKCARAMMIVHNDGAETMVSFDNKIAQRGWKFRNINGVPILVIGHGVPRRHIPLNNVKFMDLLSEDEL